MEIKLLLSEVRGSVEDWLQMRAKELSREMEMFCILTGEMSYLYVHIRELILEFIFKHIFYYITLYVNKIFLKMLNVTQDICLKNC